VIIDDEKAFNLAFDQLRLQDEAINSADTKLSVILGFVAAAVAELLGLLLLGLVEAPSSTHFTCLEKLTLFAGVFCSLFAGALSLWGVAKRADSTPFSVVDSAQKTFESLLRDLDGDLKKRQLIINRKTKSLRLSSLFFVAAIVFWATCAVCVVMHLQTLSRPGTCPPQSPSLHYLRSSIPRQLAFHRSRQMFAWFSKEPTLSLPNDWEPRTSTKKIRPFDFRSFSALLCGEMIFGMPSRHHRLPHALL
jgi:hypothetical protein